MTAATASEAFEPRIVGFLCNWCSYAGADKAGVAHLSYPPNISIIKVMCTGRIDPEFVLKAFSRGADAVLILGCHPGDCHYKEQNFRAIQRHRLLLQILRQFGIEEERCVFDFVSSVEGEKFAWIIRETVERIKALGPLQKASTTAS